ncbi:MAG: CRISPR-associated endonuclease Cas3'' [Nannocystaceae bacterium]
MRGAITTFWGKLSGDGPTREWHPLLDHCADVAACCEALLSQTLLGERLSALGGVGALDEAHIARLGVLAALHDLGKYNAGFQRKADDERATCGHVREILALFGGGYDKETERLTWALPVDTFDRWGTDGTAFKLLIAAIGHHGRPHSVDGVIPLKTARIWDADPRHDPFAGIAELVAATRRWFPAAFESGGPPLPTTSRFQHGFAGLVMLADWLGSHVGLFPYSAELHSDRMRVARERARRALEVVGLDLSRPRQALGPTRPGFSTISAHRIPQPAQETTGQLPLDRGGALTILEAETGSGKTEAAILRYIQLFQAGLVDGLYFALPTRTAATQIHGRVRDAVARAFPEGARPPVVLAVPGYLRVDDQEGTRLPGFEVLWNDDPRQRYRYRGWAAESSKRYLAGAIVVGTIDQVLLSTIMTSHAHLRATAASRQLLVVDEAHASDAYMNRLLEEVLAFHLAAGGHAFLMSATLGATRACAAPGRDRGERGVPQARRGESAPVPDDHLRAAGGRGRRSRSLKDHGPSPDGSHPGSSRSRTNPPLSRRMRWRPRPGARGC